MGVTVVYRQCHNSMRTTGRVFTINEMQALGVVRFGHESHYM